MKDLRYLVSQRNDRPMNYNITPKITTNLRFGSCDLSPRPPLQKTCTMDLKVEDYPDNVKRTGSL